MVFWQYFGGPGPDFQRYPGTWNQVLVFLYPDWAVSSAVNSCCANTRVVHGSEGKAGVLLACRTKKAVILDEDTIFLGKSVGNGCLLQKTSSLINNTLVIQKTVGVTDGWCFFLCGPVSRKIIESRVLMSREKLGAWRYQKRGRRVQTNQALPSWLPKTFLICCTKRDVKGKRIFGPNPDLGHLFLELLYCPLSTFTGAH